MYLWFSEYFVAHSAGDLERMKGMVIQALTNLSTEEQLGSAQARGKMRMPFVLKEGRSPLLLNEWLEVDGQLQL